MRGLSKRADQGEVVNSCSYGCDCIIMSCTVAIFILSTLFCWCCFCCCLRAAVYQLLLPSSPYSQVEALTSQVAELEEAIQEATEQSTMAAQQLQQVRGEERLGCATGQVYAWSSDSSTTISRSGLYLNQTHMFTLM